MDGFVQVTALVPRELKQRVFAVFALRDEKFARWLRAQMEAYAKYGEGHNETMDVAANDLQRIR